MRSNIKTITQILFLILLPELLKSQYSVSYIREIEEAYPGCNEVQLNYKAHYKIKLHKENLYITKNTSESFILLKSTFGDVFSLSVFSSEFSELTDIYAFSFSLEGKSYHQKVVNDFREKMNVDNDVFYDDVKEVIVNFPSVNAGSIMEIHSTHEIKQPYLLGTEFLASRIPIRKLELIFECEQGVDIKFIPINMSEGNAMFKVSRSGRFNTYSLQLDSVKAIITDDNAPNIRYFIPHIIPVIQSYKTKKDRIEVLTDINSLYKWYYSFVSGIIENPDGPSIKSIADSVTMNCISEIEKVNALYRWVQLNIKYIAFEYGLGGFIPRSPELVLKNKYGDCKDNSSILYSLLRSVGITTYFTWVGTNKLPYSYKQVPTPACDDHMILSYFDGSKFHFLDGTTKYYPFEYPSDFIQGKEALIAISPDSFIIQTITPPDFRMNQLCDTVWLNIEGRDLIGNGNMRLLGYPRIDFYNSLLYQKKEEEKEYVENQVLKGNNKFVLLDYNINNSGEFNADIGIEYSFDIKEYANILDDDLFVNLNMYRPLTRLLPRDNRSQPILIKYNQTSHVFYCLNIPKGYQLTYIPDPKSYKSEAFSFQIDYILDGDCIWYHQEIILNDLLIEAIQFDQLTAFLKKLESSYRESIILSRNEKN